jgi:hypothetical protein
MPLQNSPNTMFGKLWDSLQANPISVALLCFVVCLGCAHGLRRTHFMHWVGYIAHAFLVLFFQG